MWQQTLPNPQATEALGEHLANALQPGAVIHLEGELGTGKTTLARSLLRSLGFQGIVRSPTYTLLEPYEIGDWRLVHLDLYRINDPEELENLGLRDQLDAHCVVLVEWPDRGVGHLPGADLRVSLAHVDSGRRVCITPATPRGEAILAKISDN